MPRFSPLLIKSSIALGIVGVLSTTLLLVAPPKQIGLLPGELGVYSEGSGGHDLTEEERRTIDVYEKASSAVVSLTTVSTTLDQALNSQQLGGIGSGIIIDPRGYMITNYHVIKGIDALVVSLPGKNSPYMAKLIGQEPAYDLAVLKLEPNERGETFASVAIGKSDGLKIGQEALTIGSPLGLNGTMTKGIVSSVNRPFPTIGGRTIGMIQIDADINPGNSGGALLNSNGELIGMNTAGVLPGNASTGLNFAVPVDTLMRFVNDYIQFGEVQRPKLGVTLGVSITPPVAKMLNLNVGYGVMIESVQQDTPAARAGLQGGNTQVSLPTGDSLLIGGDVITHINRQPIVNVDVLLNTIEAMQAGDYVDFTISKQGKFKPQQVRILLDQA